MGATTSLPPLGCNASDCTVVGPLFRPEEWGPGDDVQYTNNCYSYACDIKAGWAQPGAASGRRYRSVTYSDLLEAAVADGLQPCAPDWDITANREGHLVALTIEPSSAFHWYRRDADGTWSHKRGDMLPTKHDCRGEPIFDPRSADLGPGVKLCCFFWVRKTRVTIGVCAVGTRSAASAHD